jgi:hypothetical protein
VTFSGNLDTIPNEIEQSDRDDDDYLKITSATITGCKMLSGKQVTLGHLEAVLLQVHNIVRDRESLW